MHAHALQPSAKLADIFEVLNCRVNHALNGDASKPHVLAFTSYAPGEGVTSVAANFAATEAVESDRKVLLMDGDLRRPSLHKLFKRKALKELGGERPKARAKTAKEKDLELHEPAWHVIRARPNLDVMLARRRFSDPGRPFAMPEFTGFMDQAKRKYQTIVLDCPPLSRSSGGLLLASQADGVVLVIEARRTRHEVLNRALTQLEETGARFLGVVLNRRRFPIPNFLYRMI